MLEAVLVLAAAVADGFRPRGSLLAEIALLRHQLAILQRSVARPRVTRFDRINAWSPSTSAATTAHALTKGSASRHPCRGAPRRREDHHVAGPRRDPSRLPTSPREGQSFRPDRRSSQHDPAVDVESLSAPTHASDLGTSPDCMSYRGKKQMSALMPRARVAPSDPLSPEARAQISSDDSFVSRASPLLG